MEKNRKRLVIRIILITVVTVILVLVAHICRNYFIGKELMSNMRKYIGNTNYHFTRKTMNENEKEITDIYVKNDKRASFSKKYYDEDGTQEMAVYLSGDKLNMYTETIEGKNIAMIGIDNSDNTNFFLGYYVHISQFDFLSSLISKVIVDGKVCYKVNTIFNDNPDFIFEKETGLTIRILDGNYLEEIKYEFGKVDDDIFIEPNLGEYEIIEK